MNYPMPDSCVQTPYGSCVKSPYAYRLTLRDRFRHRWENWKHRKTRRAYTRLQKDMQDTEYRSGWQSNIAMCIFDAPSHGNLTQAECNEIAVRIVRHLFPPTTPG